VDVAYLKLAGQSFQIDGPHVTIHFVESHQDSEDDRIDVECIEKPLSLHIAVFIVIRDIL
jgi:hypothetical protein